MTTRRTVKPKINRPHPKAIVGRVQQIINSGDAKLRAELDAAIDDFMNPSDAISATVISIEANNLSKAIEIVGFCMKSGVHSFSDIMLEAYKELGGALREYSTAFKHAYLFYWLDADDQTSALMTDVKEIRSFDIDEFLSHAQQDIVLRELTVRVDPLAQKAIAHWKAHRPKKYNTLKKKGRLEKMALKAAAQTREELQQLRDQGMPEDIAWELVEQNYILLPEEEDIDRSEDSDKEDDSIVALLQQSIQEREDLKNYLAGQ